MTTSTLRREAQDAADRCDFRVAASLMKQAIENYPTTGGMADLNKAKMQQKLRSWQAAQ